MLASQGKAPVFPPVSMIFSYLLKVILVKPALQLQTELEGYASLKSKITQMIKHTKIVRAKRGVYVTSLQEPRLPLAQVLRGPRYISFLESEYADPSDQDPIDRAFRIRSTKQ